MDYSTYLNGIAKEELDSLDRLAGHFEIETCEIDIEIESGDKKPPADDWEKTKEYLKETLRVCRPNGMAKIMKSQRNSNSKVDLIFKSSPKIISPKNLVEITALS